MFDMIYFLPLRLFLSVKSAKHDIGINWVKMWNILHKQSKFRKIWCKLGKCESSKSRILRCNPICIRFLCVITNITDFMHA